jgi:hypothetical protein
MPEAGMRKERGNGGRSNIYGGGLIENFQF